VAGGRAYCVIQPLLAGERTDAVVGLVPSDRGDHEGHRAERISVSINRVEKFGQTPGSTAVAP
jgi:hypothetical protein